MVIISCIYDALVDAIDLIFHNTRTLYLCFNPFTLPDVLKIVHNCTISSVSELLGRDPIFYNIFLHIAFQSLKAGKLCLLYLEFAKCGEHS